MLYNAKGLGFHKNRGDMVADGEICVGGEGIFVVIWRLFCIMVM